MTATFQTVAAGLLRGRSQARVLAAMGPQQPDELLSALVLEARAKDVELTLLFADLKGSWSFLDEDAAADVAEGRLHLVTIAGATPRRWAAWSDHLPLSMWDVDRAIASGQLPVDIFVAVVVPGRRAGTVELGDMVGYTPSALVQSTLVGLQIREGRRFPGPAAVPIERAHDVVRTSGRAQSSVRSEAAPTAVQDAVGRRVADLIPDGATLQLGLGAVPAAVARHLGTKRDLGLHSGILAAPLRHLIQTGVANGSRKSVDAGLHVTTGVLDGGSEQTMWGDAVRLQPVSRTNAPDLLLRHERLWAVNSAFEIDLAGQPNAECSGGLRVASAGGQADFVRAAHASQGGAAVLALPARTTAGVSRIVAHLTPPAVAAAPGGDIDLVVTEYGTAQLTGRTAAERAQALVAIAHPDDRAALRRALTDNPHTD